ncbi:MAG TPA: ferric reductase-like transmembrane domain-containing protein [Solirubrobacteraceae bacterium]
MSAVASSLGPTTYWYLTRASGAVALVLLTMSVCLGILGPLRFSAPRWPRFAVDSLHRDVSLAGVALIVVHVVTTVLDGFAPINLVDGLIPFLSPYRPLWLGLGTLSFDLILALVVTSLVRRRLGYAAWRAIHWLAYVSWPVAVLHGLGTGTDVKQWWMLLLTVICIAGVVAAVLARINVVDRRHGAIRTGAFVLSVIAPVGLGIFAAVGPLAHGWARRAGTPASLLPPSTSAVSVSTASHSASTGSDPTAHSFSAVLAGRVVQRPASSGAIVQLDMTVRGSVRGRLRVRLGGQPLDSGGLSLTGSQVDLSVAGAPQVFAGRVVNLEGDHFLARVSDSAGTELELDTGLTIDQARGTVSGTLSSTPIGAGG